MDALQLVFGEEQLFAARAGLEDLEEGKYAGRQLRVRWSSMFPVPLNSSKMMSSMREPVIDEDACPRS